MLGRVAVEVGVAGNVHRMSALGHVGPAVAVFVPELAGAAPHTRAYLAHVDMHHVAVCSRNSCRPIARIRPRHDHNHGIARHTGCRSRYAAVSAVEAPVRSIAAGAAVGAAAGSCRTAAGMPWQAEASRWVCLEAT